MILPATPLLPLLTAVLTLQAPALVADPIPLGSILESELQVGVPLQIPRREPGARFAWSVQFASAPGQPGDPCLEGQYAWDSQFLYSCVPPGRWVWIEPTLY